MNTDEYGFVESLNRYTVESEDGCHVAVATIPRFNGSTIQRFSK
jgi:hypothetical protein